jgi:ParB-like chromosome segregation protein Spo0J
VARPAFGLAGHAAASCVLGSPETTLTGSLPYLFVIDLLNWPIAIHRSLNMLNNANAKRLEKWKLADLKPHPRQGDLFHDAQHDPGDKDLADDMRANGLQCPVEILPDGTILCGHRRTRVAQALGWDEVEAWVRDDLAGRPEAAELRLIEDNLNRRHLGPLELARCYRLQKELARQLARQLPRHLRRPCQSGDFRDLVAQKLGVSGRNLDRYLRVLDAPPAVQRAVEGKELSIQEGGAVAVMPKEVQQEVARRIEAGERAKGVVRALLPEKAATHRKASTARRAFARALEAGLNDLKGRVGQVTSIGASEAELYRAAIGMLNTILERAQVYDDSPEACEARFDALLDRLGSVAG